MFRTLFVALVIALVLCPSSLLAQKPEPVSFEFNPINGVGFVPLITVQEAFGLNNGAMKKAIENTTFLSQEFRSYFLTCSTGGSQSFGPFFSTTFVSSNPKEGKGNQVLGWSLNGLVDPFRVDPVLVGGCPGGTWSKALTVSSFVSASVDSEHYLFVGGATVTIYSADPNVAIPSTPN